MFFFKIRTEFLCLGELQETSYKLFYILFKRVYVLFVSLKSVLILRSYLLFFYIGRLRTLKVELFIYNHLDKF